MANAAVLRIRHPSVDTLPMLIRAASAACPVVEVRMHVVSRLISLSERVNWLAPLVGGRIAALHFWMRSRSNPELRAKGRFHDLPFCFRGLDAMALREVFCDAEYAFATPQLEGTPQPVVLDIGAHIGCFGIWLAAHFPLIRTLSVEADPDTFAVLERNVEALRARGLAWEAVHAAAWLEGGEALRFTCSGPSMSHRISEHGEISVPSITLRELMSRLVGDNGNVDLMKVDIEGSEEAFLCAEPSLLNRVRCLVVELHPHLCDAPRIRRMLSSTYSRIEEMQSRTSSKPLLLCY